MLDYELTFYLCLILETLVDIYTKVFILFYFTHFLTNQTLPKIFVFLIFYLKREKHNQNFPEKIHSTQKTHDRISPWPCGSTHKKRTNDDDETEIHKDINMTTYHTMKPLTWTLKNSKKNKIKWNEKKNNK
jgi:hypothetical protein